MLWKSNLEYNNESFSKSKYSNFILAMGSTSKVKFNRKKDGDNANLNDDPNVNEGNNMVLFIINYKRTTQN